MRRRDSSDDTLESFHAAELTPATDDRRLIGAGVDRRTPPRDDPRRMARSLLRHFRLLAVSIVIGAALGWLSALVAHESDPAPVPVDRYQAGHVLIFDGNVPRTQAVLSIRNLNTLAKRTTVGELPRVVAELTDLTPTEAATRVRVLIRSDSETLDIVTIGETPAQAEELADAYASQLFAHLQAEAEAYGAEALASAEGRLAEADSNLNRIRSELGAAREAEDEDAIALLEQDEQQSLSARIFANANLLEVRADGVPIVPLETLQSASGTAAVISSARFDELVDRAARGQNVEVLFGDETESSSSSGALSVVSSRLPSGVGPRLAAGAAAGLMLGLMAAIFLNRVDNRVRSKRQVEELVDLPVVAEVPPIGRSRAKKHELVARQRPRSHFAEVHRGLASTIGYARSTRDDRPTQVVLVTSPGPAEGKTTTAANLAAMSSEAGDRVLLVNCDFRRPRLHLHVGSEDVPAERRETDLPGVDIISNALSPAGATPVEVVSAQRRMIEEALGDYDVVIIDTAPLLATNDAVGLLDLVDDVLLVLRAGKTTVHGTDRAAEVLERRRAHVLGVVITAVDARTAEDYYYYGSYYDDASRSGSRRLGLSQHGGSPSPTEPVRGRLLLRTRGSGDHPTNGEVEEPAVEPDDGVMATAAIDDDGSDGLVATGFALVAGEGVEQRATASGVAVLAKGSDPAMRSDPLMGSDPVSGPESPAARSRSAKSLTVAAVGVVKFGRKLGSWLGR